MPDAKGRKALPVILQRLHAAYPNARYELNWDTPVQLLVATILAAQCTDERVNEVTRTLFKKYPDARAFADADEDELAEDVRPTGFFNQKARTVKAACQALVQRFGDDVPRDMDDMLTLPGVARKTANVVLTNAYKIPSGIIVDTHVARVAQRLGLADESKPEKIEYELMEEVPEKEWIFFGPAVVLHGRYTCTSSNPKCPSCVLESVCEKRGVNGAASSAEDEDEEEAPVPAKKSAARKPAAPAKTPAKQSSGSASGGTSLDVSEIPASWRHVLSGEFEKPYFKALKQFVDDERKHHTVFPPEKDVFNALKYTPYGEMKVLLLGQDPYHDDGQAHGLCFSVQSGIKPPPSLVNMFKELKDDVGCRIPNNGYLVPWAEQGVLLLNAVLTVRAHEPNSHKDKGWEQFTDAIIKAASDRADPMVFVLWGAYAQKKEKIIDDDKHVILKAAHPSPLSAKKFFGSRPFSAINNALKKMGKSPIDWQIPDL
jgi:uracil-DNA glycosylase